MTKTVVMQFQVQCSEKQMEVLVDFLTEFTKDPTILAAGTLMTNSEEFTLEETQALMAKRGFMARSDGAMQYTHKEKVDH